MESSIQIIIICCNEERRTFQKKQMEDLNLPYVFFDAYTPKTMGDYITEKHKEYPEKDTTICCLRSHIGALKMFVDKFSKKEFVVIVEDDVVLINNFVEELNKILIKFKLNKSLDFITLGIGLGQFEKPKSTFSDENLVWGNMLVWGTMVQLFPISIAKEMVQLLDKPNTTLLYNDVLNKKHAIQNGMGYTNKTMRLQSDAVFSILWRQGCVWPPMAIENENFNSVITPLDKNNRWQFIFDLNIRKKEEFYKPIDLLNNIPQPYVINLHHRKDRWQETQEEFKKLDIIPRRIDAVYNKDDGAKGCMASHIKTLTEGIQSNLPIWVCEDDIEILVSKNVLFSIIDEFLKSDGVILCLGNNTIKKNHYNEVFDRGFEIQTASSYIIKPSFAIILRNHWKEINEYIAEGKTHFSELLFRQTDMYGKNAYQHIDINWKILQQYFIFLVPKIRCIKQRESYSDIENKVVNYNV